MLGEIEVVTKCLQTRAIPLSDCQWALDELSNDVTEHRNVCGHNLHGCELLQHCIQQGAEILEDPHFESGIVKLQAKKVNELTEQEREALQNLRKEFQANGPASLEAVTMNEKIAKRKRDATDTGNDEHVNVSWVLGSAAEVERLWSVAKCILTETWRQMDPAMFETIIFLKINQEHWSQATVCEAMRRRP
jgi:hypothetical protein